MTDPLDLELLRQALAGTPFAAKLHHFPTIGSTNTHAVAEAQSGAPAGSVYIADEQTAGRGRGSHAWHSAPGDGLYVSILVRPALAARDALWLSLAAGLAVHNAVNEVTGLQADIRWPNDLLIGEKKFCGILTETAFEGDLLKFAVIGIGINVGHREFPADLAAIATSLRIASGTPQHRQPILIALLRSLADELAALTTTQPTGAGILDRLRAASTWIDGRQVRVEEDGGYLGTTAGLDARGFLRVRTVDGMRTVLSGGVRSPRE